MRMKSVILLSAILLTTIAAVAQKPMPTSHLRDSCQSVGRLNKAIDTKQFSTLSPTDEQEAGFCYGYIAGWLFSQQNYPITSGDKVIGYVTPKKAVTVEQLQLLFSRYVEAHPEALTDPANETLTAVAKEANLMGVKMKDGKWR